MLYDRFAPPDGRSKRTKKRDCSHCFAAAGAGRKPTRHEHAFARHGAHPVASPSVGKQGASPASRGPKTFRKNVCTTVIIRLTRGLFTYLAGASHPFSPLACSRTWPG